MISQEKNFVYKERMYNDSQLGQLQEITSLVDCECPNQVSTIVHTLSSYEAYSKTCINKNDKDAELHKMLYEKTCEARAIMEEALREICIYENIYI